MVSRSIDHDLWGTELAAFSRQHEGWLVSIRRSSPDGETVVEALDVPLESVSPTVQDNGDIAVDVGGGTNHLTHHIHEPVALRIELTDDRAPRALIVDARDGSTTRVEFRSPVRAEEVDGMPTPSTRP